MDSTSQSRIPAKLSIKPLKLPDKPKPEPRRDEHELETQVIMRMPEEPARILREVLREGGTNLKDRLNVKMETDMRYGEVRFDHWLLYAKLVDLPTIIESLKTIDNKSFYKTADICQMLICKEEPEEPPTTDEESPTKNKKKDPHKVDKKYLWPHGVTPPCKNVRKRRFRKTLKKKCVEAPEIEKEIKRLLRADNEAVNVKWEIVKDEDEQKNQLLQNEESQSQMELETPSDDLSEKIGKKHKPSTSKSHGDAGDIRDIDIFGEDLSSTDDEDNNINVDVDDTSRLSADDSRQSFYSNSMHGGQSTEFNKEMFNSPRSRFDSSNLEPPSTPDRMRDYDGSRAGSEEEEMQNDAINEKIAKLRRDMNDLHAQRIQKEQEISTIENQTLRQRMQNNLDDILSQLLNKEMEIQMYQAMLESDN